jgi:asparagine synthase (glutamine-hydrolysing)
VSGAALRLAETFLPERLRGHPAWKAASYACGGRGGAPMEWHARSRTLLEPHHIAMLLGVTESAIHVSTTSGDLRESLGRDLPARGPGSWLREYLLIETETYLANTLLRDNDVTSMAHSLELRVPLVDREVFALAGRLPPDSLIHFDGGKRVLREAFRDLLPEWIYEDRQKKTFTLPLMKWMRHPRWRERIHDTLTSTRSRQRDWVRPESVTWLMDRYFKSTASGKTSFALSQPVWMLFVLESWAREHLDGPAA